MAKSFVAVATCLGNSFHEGKVKKDIYSFLEPAITAGPKSNALALVSGQTFSFENLSKAIQNLTINLSDQGISPGDWVWAASFHPIINYCMTIALSRLGAVSLLGTKLEDILNDNIRLDAAILQQTTHVQGPQNIHFNFDWINSTNTTPKRNDWSGFENPEDIAVVFSSSGTSGKAKYCPYTIDLFNFRLPLFKTFFGDKPDARMTVMNVNTALGFLMLTHTLLTGGLGVIRDHQNQKTLAFCKKYKVHEIIASPSFAIALAKEQNENSLKLPDLQKIMVGGGPISKSAVIKIQKSIGVDVLIGFGSTEIGHITATRFNEIEGTPGAVGYIAPWVSVEALDENGLPLPAGETGSLQINVGKRACIPGYSLPTASIFLVLKIAGSQAAMSDTALKMGCLS